MGNAAGHAVDFTGTGAGVGTGSNYSACVRTFTGHQNQKNFVGMSVTPTGHVACGSEDNAVYLYARCVPTPIARQSLAVPAFQRGGGGGGGGQVTNDKPGLFVSSVAWSPDGCQMIAANSCGAVKIMEIDSN